VSSRQIFKLADRYLRSPWGPTVGGHVRSANEGAPPRMCGHQLAGKPLDSPHEESMPRHKDREATWPPIPPGHAAQQESNNTAITEPSSGIGSWVSQGCRVRWWRGSRGAPQSLSQTRLRPTAPGGSSLPHHVRTTQRDFHLARPHLRTAIVDRQQRCYNVRVCHRPESVTTVSPKEAYTCKS